MRLAMVYDYACAREGATLWTHRAYGSEIDALAAHFERIIVMAPLAAARSAAGLGYAIEASNVELLPLPFFERWVAAIPATLTAPVLLAQRRADWDVLYVRVPGPLALAAFLVARVLKRPACLHIVGDLLGQMADYPRLLRPLARLAAHGFDYGTSLMARYSLTITQGQALADRYGGPGRSVVSMVRAPIRARDICAPGISPLHRPIRLLFVGALLQKKGVQYLLESLAQLQTGMDFTLTVIGSGPAKDQLRALAERVGVLRLVHFVGPLETREEILQAYRSADLFVLPSLAEGVARVLPEAMSQGLPVVSTRVGGIPSLIRDGWDGILVEPGSASALGVGIKAVVSDDSLRRRLIINGIETARRYTLEAYAAEFERLLNQHVAERFLGHAN